MWPTLNWAGVLSAAQWWAIGRGNALPMKRPTARYHVDSGRVCVQWWRKRRKQDEEKGVRAVMSAPIMWHNEKWPCYLNLPPPALASGFAPVPTCKHTGLHADGGVNWWYLFPDDQSASHCCTHQSGWPAAPGWTRHNVHTSTNLLQRAYGSSLPPLQIHLFRLLRILP